MDLRFYRGAKAFAENRGAGRDSVFGTVFSGATTYIGGHRYTSENDAFSTAFAGKCRIILSAASIAISIVSDVCPGTF